MVFRTDTGYMTEDEKKKKKEEEEPEEALDIETCEKINGEE